MNLPFRPQTYRLLLVEDEVTIRQLYAMKLRLCGFIVEEAVNGIEGLEKVASAPPDLLLLDIRMPEMSGDEMLRQLRATEWGESLKVLILTNISKSEAPHSLRLLGVTDYIVKAHTTPQQLVDIITNVLTG
jgi:CheY-like chemotaxis protein